MFLFFFLRIRRPPRSTRTDTLFPYTTLFRSYRLTLFVMDQAIRSAAQLRDRGLAINMSVNLSAALLDHGDLVGTIRVMLTAHHLSPEMLTIEVTETAQIENSRQARQTLAQLRRTGIRLSIDDYGTGQSNLEYLTEVEADEIKIDKRFEIGRAHV